MPTIGQAWFGLKLLTEMSFLGELMILDMQVKYDDSAKETNPALSAFTRRREIWVGRTASEPPIHFCTAFLWVLFWIAPVWPSESVMGGKGFTRCFCVTVTGFICAVIGEILTGKGALGQLQLETRLPQNVINLAVVGIVVRTLLPSGHRMHYYHVHARGFTVLLLLLHTSMYQGRGALQCCYFALV